MSSDVAEWWSTAIIDMAPNRIKIRGHHIESLIGEVTFPQMIWLMTRGDLPSRDEALLFESALVAAVDHGPQAPSVATARMAVTCGLGLNGALASGVNMLDDIHGGAGEQAVELFRLVEDAVDSSGNLESAAAEVVERWRAERSKYLPGFGHRFHNVQDPRAPRLLSLVDEAAERGTVSGRFARIACALEAALVSRSSRPIPLNIDGATAVIYAELGFEGPLARGLFCLSRSVGLVAHAWEQMQQGGRNKGPTPPQYRWKYTGR